MPGCRIGAGTWRVCSTASRLAAAVSIPAPASPNDEAHCSVAASAASSRVAAPTATRRHAASSAAARLPPRISALHSTIQRSLTCGPRRTDQLKLTFDLGTLKVFPGLHPNRSLNMVHAPTQPAWVSSPHMLIKASVLNGLGEYSWHHEDKAVAFRRGAEAGMTDHSVIAAVHIEEGFL